MSEVYSPFRSVGLCSNAVPLSVSAKGTSILIATAVGKAFHVYDGDKLRLLFTSPYLDDEITTLAQHRGFTYLGCGGYLKCFKRGKECWSVREEAEVLKILLVGEYLLSIHTNNVLKIWDIRNKDVYSEISFDRKSFNVISVVHPATYLNKVLLGSEQGSLQLWNIRTGKLVYSFAGWDSAVMTLVQSPALDVMGVGLRNGNVVLHNVRTDLSLMTFTQTIGPVTTIAFRTDGINHMLTGSNRSGDIIVWDLDSRRLGSVMSHTGNVNGMECLPQQPLLVTCSQDNSIKIWIFDNNSARLLKERAGHSAPPTFIRFINRSSLISAGLDKCVRVISLHNDSHNKEMSQGTKKGKGGKLPVVCDLAFELTRRYEWDAMVTCHHGNRYGHTWSMCNGSIGSHSLKLKQAGATPLCCCVSGCGNYTILGSSHGDIEVFNMQSGMRRKHIKQAHSGAVRGVAINILCTEIYSCGSDGLIKVWSYTDATCIATVSLNCPVAKQCYHSNSSLLAVSTDLCDIIICDMDTRAIVRQFTGHNMGITDMCFTSDGRWLLSSAMDCTIRTYDIPSGQLLDCMILEAPPTSITMSPTGEYLAASIVDELGVRIWVNTTLYTSYKPRPLMTATPSLSPLEGGLITLSGLATPHWINLTQLDIIKERNKPIQPPKQPALAPFFLPTLSGLEMSFDSSNRDRIPEQEKDQASRIMQLSKVINEDSLFQKQLTIADSNGMDVLKSLGPSQVDREIQLLSGEEQCLAFLKLILESLKSCKDFELTESYLSLYLKYHRATTDSEVLEEIYTEHKKSWKLLQEQFNFSLCLLTYCKHFSV